MKRKQIKEIKPNELDYLDFYFEKIILDDKGKKNEINFSKKENNLTQNDINNISYSNDRNQNKNQVITYKNKKYNKFDNNHFNSFTSYYHTDYNYNNQNQYHNQNYIKNYTQNNNSKNLKNYNYDEESLNNTLYNDNTYYTFYENSSTPYKIYKDSQANSKKDLFKIKNKKNTLVDNPSQNKKVPLTDSNQLNNEIRSKQNQNQNENNFIKKKPLHVDILNYSTLFFDCKNHWNVSKAEKKIRKFVDRCRNTGYEPIVFIDGCNITEEAQNKWKQRREKEVKSGKRNVPQNLNLLFHNIFKENNVKVHFSFEADNDDTLAAYASQTKGYVVSQDRDFLRYYDASYSIFTSFHYQRNNKIFFEKQTHQYPKYGVDYRELIFPLPKTTNKWQDFMIHPTENQDNLLYRRGAPSSLVKYFGNPHVNVKELRRALYHKLGIDKNIIENFPHWNFKTNEFEWYKEITTPNSIYEHLLYKPFEAVDYFFRDLTKPNHISKEDWNNHLYAINIVVFELCSIALDCSLLSILKQSKYVNRPLDF